MSAPNTVILVGPPGAGKSTVARRLARALGTVHTDTDTMIEQARGRSCGDVFSEVGEPAFRELEARVVAETLTREGVVSLGGGAVTTPKVREMLANHDVVWIDVSAEEGVRRTADEATRPILAAADPLAHYHDLLDSREEFYREVSDLHVRTDGRTPAQVVTEVLAGLENLAPRTTPDCDLERVAVRGPSPYTVTIGHGLTDAVAAHLVDTGVHHVGVVHQPPLAARANKLVESLRAAGLDAHALPVADAEDGKTLESIGRLWAELGRLGFTRTDALVGLGGGAATDLAGFAAACWMRGIRVVQVPTTVLAMVDAAVGGKTGINTEAGKNLVGAFHEPSAVFCDLDHLVDLPKRELVAGSAEIVKTGFIADPVILRRYEEDPAAALRADGFLPELVRRSITVKASVVGKDLKEAGLREILNYGHTFGHAVERRENYRWRHGDAVAVGMVFVAELAHARDLIDAALVQRHRDILESVGLPTVYRDGRWEELREAMSHDKKNRDGRLRFVALDGKVGRTTRIEGPSEEELRAAYAAVGGTD